MQRDKTMKFGYMVKHNGKYYAAGEDVPVEQENKNPALTVPEKPTVEEPAPKRRGRTSRRD